jgi:transposase
MEKQEKKDNSSIEVKKKRYSKGLPVFNPYAAGIDIGDILIDVAVSDGADGHEVRQYKTFTDDLVKIVEDLKSDGITTVAIESTGVYWLNIYLMIEEAGIEPYLVNSRHVKNVTGRKKDDTDAIWLHKLHSCGLLQKSFQPEGEIRVLRTYVRQRKNLIYISSDSVRRMQKAMELLNIKLHTVISDLIGKTGLQMIKAILDGERNPDELIKLKDPRIKASEEEIKRSLKGIWKEEYLFTLKQAFEEYLFYQNQISSCDEKIIEQLIKQVAIVLDGDVTDLNIIKKNKIKKNQIDVNISPLLKTIVGVDLCKVVGISEISCLGIISETGTDMTKWPNSKHFTAWLNVAPNTKITGGKIISSKMQKKKNYAGQTLRMSASGLSKSKTPMGDYARKMKSRLGKKGGVVATAHKLAKIIYVMIKEQREYNPEILIKNQEGLRLKRIKFLEKQIEQLKKVG